MFFFFSFWVCVCVLGPDTGMDLSKFVILFSDLGVFWYQGSLAFLTGVLVPTLESVKKKLFFSFIETYNNHFFFLAIVTEDITNTVHEFAKGWHDTRPNHTLIFWTINLTINLSKQQPRHNRINREDLQSIHINEYNAIDHHHRGLQGRRRGGWDFWKTAVACFLYGLLGMCPGKKKKFWAWPLTSARKP